MVDFQQINGLRIDPAALKQGDIVVIGSPEDLPPPNYRIKVVEDLEFSGLPHGDGRPPRLEVIFMDGTSRHYEVNPETYCPGSRAECIQDIVLLDKALIEEMFEREVERRWGENENETMQRPWE